MSELTARQEEVLAAVQKHGSNTKAAKALGVTRQVVDKQMKSIRARTASKDPSEHLHGAPEGYSLKGVSAFHGKDGGVSYWVKTDRDRQAQFKALIDAVENGLDSWKPYKRVKAPTGKHDADLLTQLVITDFHLGMLAWGKETGESWDSNIARDVFLSAIHDMIEASPKSEVGILVQLGDFLHFDGLEAVTPSSHHILDAESRYGRLVEITMTVMPEAVKLMLEHFKKVVVVQAEGNHDLSGSVWIRKFVKHLFKDNPRVEVIDNEFPYYAYLHGETLLGYHHGHKAKKGDLPKVFSSEPRFRSMWGQSTRCYIHTGHYHHEVKLEDAGATVEQHPTLASRDAYAARLGLVSNRGAKVHVYHKTEGEMNVHTVRPRL